LSYLIDHRYESNSACSSETANEDPAAAVPEPRPPPPTLSEDDQDTARNFVIEKSEEFILVLAAYETKDTTIFPRKSFIESMKKSSPLKYWTCIQKISRHQPVKEFCTMMMEISSCPPSSAGIERLFSSMALIQTKQRNRLTMIELLSLSMSTDIMAGATSSVTKLI
jgi:hypothetical protein